MSGLIELLFVFFVVFAWGLYELRSMRRHRTAPKATAAPREPAPDQTKELG